MFDNLILGPGGTLTWRDIHRQDSKRPVARDVAEHAEAFLFEPVSLHPDLTLGDVFKLLDKCLTLQQVFRRSWAVQLCEEARKGPLPQRRDGDPVEVAGIEYLELFWSWALDTSSNTYRSVHGLDLHGVGRALMVDAPTYQAKAGDRIKWSVSLTPVRELLELPLRLRDELTITEDDIDAKAYSDVVAGGRCTEVLLGQVIGGVLGEIGFHGGPDEQLEFKEELDRRSAEAAADPSTLIPADDVLARYDRPGFEMLFETLGDVAHGDVRQAMRQIGDAEAAGPALHAAFEGKVVVRAQFWGRAGREFRKAFRAAGR